MPRNTNREDYGGRAIMLFEDEDPRTRFDGRRTLTLRGPVGPVVRGTMGVLFVAFIAELVAMFASGDGVAGAKLFTETLAPSRVGVFEDGLAHQLLTGCVFYPPEFFLGGVTLVFLLWLFGRQAEQLAGSGLLLAAFLVSGVASSLLGVALDTTGQAVVAGPTALVFTVIMAFTLLGRGVVVFEVLPASWLSGFLGVVALLVVVASGAPGLVRSAPISGVIAGIACAILAPRLHARRRRLREWAHAHQREEDLSTRLRVDVLLDKINRRGIENLTEEERRFLDSASRRFRRQ